jgi:DNA-binding response OmpR family regulator
MDVEVVRYPMEGIRLDELRREGCPRLLLVEGDADPPLILGDDEDWIRSPADPRDVRARLDRLMNRMVDGVGKSPCLDDDGVLRVGEKWVSLPPIEARLVKALLERQGAVVSRETLAAKGWPGTSPARNVLDVHVLRLRRRVAGVDLVIRTVRSRGYLLERVRYTAGETVSALSAGV